MNDEIVNLKGEDEIYCPECGKTIKRNAVICSYCGIQVKALVVEHIKDDKIITNLRSRKVALWLVLFFGIFSWLYTWKKDWWKFLICIFSGPIISFIFIRNETIAVIIYIAMYLWSAVDVTIRDEKFYKNYPYV